jgi:N-acyl homoserine lactone hydrolase
MSYREPHAVLTELRKHIGQSQSAAVVAVPLTLVAKAQLWINHDKAQRDSLKMAPDLYD